MPKVDQLAKLFHAIGQRDMKGAKAYALALAEHEARAGHFAAADRLRGALLQSGGIGNDSDARNGSVRFDLPLLDGTLTPLNSPIPLSAVALRPAARHELESVLAEWGARDRLREHGISRRTKLFFHGPPGCGKTVTAAALGHSLHLPTYVVRFDGIVGALLGQTALRVRELFRFAESEPCVLVIDEIDALGKRRGNALDVGELDRVVISLMQALEHTAPAGLIVASSNVPRLLDDALARRFDVTLAFPRPKASELDKFAQSRSSELGLRLSPALKQRLASARDYASVEMLIVSELRRHIVASG